jgi:hypothetical protein
MTTHYSRCLLIEFTVLACHCEEAYLTYADEAISQLNKAKARLLRSQGIKTAARNDNL